MTVRLIASAAIPLNASAPARWVDEGGLVFLLDVDNTLLDADRFVSDLHRRFEGQHEAALGQLAAFEIDYPFADRLFPRALEVIAHLGRFGRTGLLSDGDIVLPGRRTGRRSRRSRHSGDRVGSERIRQAAAARTG